MGIQARFLTDIDIYFQDWGEKGTHKGKEIDIVIDRAYLDSQSASRLKRVATLKESQSDFKQHDTIIVGSVSYVIEEIEPDTPGLLKALVRTT
jgi:hypothetical protein